MSHTRKTKDGARKYRPAELASVATQKNGINVYSVRRISSGKLLIESVSMHEIEMWLQEHLILTDEQKKALPKPTAEAVARAFSSRRTD